MNSVIVRKKKTAYIVKFKGKNDVMAFMYKE
jgi:hypothetical protein